MKPYLREIKKNILKNLTRLPTKFGMQAPLLVNEDGEVEKNLEVTYAGEGQGRNRKLDKDGNTIYEIKGAGDLRGKNH